MMRGMALIEANRLAVTIPNGPDDPPTREVASERVQRWLEGQYGYRPPVERLEGHGWSARWVVAGAASSGWRYEAVIPRHLGPARADVEAGRPARAPRSHHPAGRGVARPRVAAARRPRVPTPLPGLGDGA